MLDVERFKNVMSIDAEYSMDVWKANDSANLLGREFKRKFSDGDYEMYGASLETNIDALEVTVSVAIDKWIVNFK